MRPQPLAGTGVLVTRPAHQAGELVDAITAAGGKAHLFPVMDIRGRDASELEADIARLESPDIVVFVSANAVRHGVAALPQEGATVVAIGPATAAALAAAGIPVDVVPVGAADTEALVGERGLASVDGRVVTIVRGETGRELLGRTLQQRGARVQYLPAYRVEPHRFEPGELAALESLWTCGGIDAIVVMSALTFELLLAALPPACAARLGEVLLVAPSDRVIQTALDRIPGLRFARAPGPRPADMVAALAAGEPCGAGPAR